MGASCPQCGGHARFRRELTRDAWVCDACEWQDQTELPRGQQLSRAVEAIRHPRDPGADEALSLLSEAGKDGLLAILAELFSTGERRAGTCSVSTCAAIFVLGLGLSVALTPWGDVWWMDRHAGLLTDIFYASVIVTAIGFFATLWANRRSCRRDDALTWAGNLVLAGIQSPDAAPSLARAMAYANLRPRAREQFIAAVNADPAAAAKAIEELGDRSVRRLLEQARVADWPLVCAATRALAHTSDGQSAIDLNSFARNYRHLAPSALIAEADAASEAIVARNQQAQHNQQLLRSASPEDADPSTLLRRPSQEDQAEHLLRRGEPE